MSVTIKDVAKLCGVSVSTVSRVLNGYTDISEETAKKVYEAIRKLDFVPSNTARMLSKKGDPDRRADDSGYQGSFLFRECRRRGEASPGKWLPDILREYGTERR